MLPSVPLRALLVTTQAHACALPLEDVIETMRPLPIRPLAGTPRFVLGVAMVRGQALPVLDLGALLGAPPASDARRFVTVRVGTRQAALAVASVDGIAGFTPHDFQALPPLLGGADGVEALRVTDGQLFLTLQAARLLPEDLASLIPPDEEVS